MNIGETVRRVHQTVLRGLAAAEPGIECIGADGAGVKRISGEAALPGSYHVIFFCTGITAPDQACAEQDKEA